MFKKRRHEQPNVDVEAVEIYEDLANENEGIRLQAAQKLLSKVSAENVPSVEQLEKILKRLIRGLCSGRKAARLGFSVALTELLVQHTASRPDDIQLSAFSVSKVIDILDEQTRVTGSVAGQEERDHYFGRLFGAESIIKSGIAPRSNCIDQWERVIDFVFELSKKKSWLREECGWVIHGALDSSHMQLQPTGLEYMQIVLDKLHSNGLSRTPEGVAIWITAHSRFPQLRLAKHVWHHENPLHRSEKSALAKVLMETTSKDGSQTGIDKSAQKGMWSSKLHFAWSIVFEVALEERSECVTFSDLWIEAVDDGLFASSSSSERKSWGFMLFQSYVPTTPASQLSVLFGKNFSRCLVNQLAVSDRFLHRLAEKTLKTIHSRVEHEPNTAAIILRGLFHSNEYVNFDSQTKTKTVERLLMQADFDSFDEIVSIIADVVSSPGTADVKSASTIRQLVADYLLSAVRSRPYPEASNDDYEKHRRTIDHVLSLFVKHAYFTTENAMSSPKPQISDSSRELFRSRTTSMLTHLIAKAPDAAYHPYKVLLDIRSRKEDDDSATPLLTYDTGDAVGKSIQHACKILEKINTKEHSATSIKKDYIRAFKLLYTLTILQVYNGDADAVSIIDELEGCYKTLIKHDFSEASAEGAEILIEILLSLVSKPSLLFRRLAQQVFSVCTSVVNANSLISMASVLHAKEDNSGQDEMFERADDATSDVDMSDEGTDDSDVERVNEKDSDETSAAGGKNEASGTSEDDEDDDEELIAFDKKLAQALGTRRADEDLAVGGQESSDEDMNDEEMEALDVHLEKMFSERKKATSKKKERKQAKETIILFKCRVLELLEIYVKQQYVNELALNLIPDLLTVIRQTTSRQVSEKACNLVRDYSKSYKMKDRIRASDDRDVDITSSSRELLAGVHEESCKEGSNAHGTACSQASLLLAKVFISTGGDVQTVVDQYAQTQKRFLTDSECKARTSFFSDWLNWCTSARKNLAP